ncbi:uncharacterized protein LOC119383891 isoform X2 [Rhipicephalus sanguineus]|uniref:uncharacterized protein LOC119383891 isoform X2 n=1 Tax=Rhipicephalus sanguineus TaxID=34632 RepID=UPI0020C1CB76|nr:uncharacterized protein LOC119383891 isoform X2 [Rhipicephalus sanguineus]
MSGKKVYVRCDIDNCKGGTGESTHRVPDDAEMRQTWLRLMGWPATTTRARMFVCGRHFTPDDYTRNPDVMQSSGFQFERIRLKKGAVPSLFLPNSPPPEHSEIQGTEGAVASDDPGNKLTRPPPSCLAHLTASAAALRGWSPHSSFGPGPSVVTPASVPGGLLFLPAVPVWPPSQRLSAVGCRTQLAATPRTFPAANFSSPVSKCYCSCHPETSTKFVQTYSRGVQRQSTTSTQTDVSITQTCVPSMLTHVTKVVNTCRCSCHCVMSTAAVQTTPIARCTCCAQTDDSFLYAKATHVDAGLQVCLDATICVTVRVQTDPKPPVVPCEPVVEDSPRPVKGSRRGAKGSRRGAKGSRRGAKGSRRRVVKRRK